MPNRDTNSPRKTTSETPPASTNSGRGDPNELAGESAIAHVERTLESDPEFNGIGSKGYDTPEAQIAGEAGSGEVDTRKVSEEGFDPRTGRRTQAPRTARRPEPLVTHLAGDTSSDPHTDVGRDNATTVQQRGERKGRR